MNMFKTLLVLAGFTQLAIAASSIAIPRLLDWPKETALLRPLTRYVFWTYACYILGNHLWFSVLAIGWPEQLLAGTPLAALVTGFITLYWLARVVIQFVWFHSALSDDRLLFKAAEVAYVSAFVYVTVVFGLAAIHNLRLVIK
ncbi:MAG: hypothetical protein QOK37_1466 [Thermoanaerobaculia bacterium]|jgi:hypothetical protein|nr:hypothetical protein [Thermoanaerobaculia bacterium]